MGSCSDILGVRFCSFELSLDCNSLDILFGLGVGVLISIDFEGWNPLDAVSDILLFWNGGDDSSILVEHFDCICGFVYLSLLVSCLVTWSGNCTLCLVWSTV